MIDRKAIEISKVSVADASQIVELQNELLLNDRRDYKDGFLVSGFREEQYRDFAVRYEYFYKIVVHGELAGVLLAYESKHIEMDEKSNMLLKYALNKEFVLIKQVFVSPDFQRKGIASFLYDYLQDIIGGKKPLVAVVVLDPFNSGSSYFHQEKGFHEFLNFVPDADPDGAVRYEYFYKIVVHGELAGVLLAYESKHIEMDEKSNMLLKYALNKEFVLIKQVFVSPDFQRKGIASFLYDYLQDIIGGKKPLVAVVVLDPFNSGSSYFHQEKGFHEFLNFVPDADPDGVVRKRAAWIKPSAEAKGNIMFDLRLNNTIDGTDDLGDVMVSRMENLVQLYIHEDNLNWTKFSLQTTILFALFATFAYFYEKEILPDTFPVLVTVGIWGAIINILFILKIRSGIRYMNTYKGKIQDFDLLVSFHYPKLKKIFNRDEFIARKSITCRLLYFTSVVGLISWVVVSVLLVCKAMHWFTIF